MEVSPEELIIPERLQFVMSNITSFRISGGYNIPAIGRVGNVETVYWESKFGSEEEHAQLYADIYSKYGRMGLFRFEYLTYMCACIRNYTKGGFGNEGIWLRPEDLPTPDYDGDKESYYPLPVSLELLDKFKFIYIISNKENTNHQIAAMCRCRDIPLITGERVYKVPIFNGPGNPNILYLRKYCWERDLREDIINTELNKRWVKEKNTTFSGRPTNLTYDQRRARQNILNKLYQTNKRYMNAKDNSDNLRMDLALGRMRILINELADSALGDLPNTWHWVRDERIS